MQFHSSMVSNLLCINNELLYNIQIVFIIQAMRSSISEQSTEQPQILLQLRQKVQELRSTQNSLKQSNKHLSNSLIESSDELNALMKEIDLQQRKSKSLVLLVSDIQRQVDDYYAVAKQDDQELLETQNRALRETLVKLAERIKQDQKLLSFLRQAIASGSKTTEFVQKSKYLEGQMELLAKLRSQIASFTNQNFECSRKWNELQRQQKRLERQSGFLRIQSERVKTQLRQHYQEYLQSLNRSKANLVNFNETQRERIITEHLVEEVALLQENQVVVQQQSRNLKHHQQILLEQNTRLQMENRELKSFFIGSTSDEQHRLANKMRSRIEELQDCLAQLQRLRNIPQLPLANLAEKVRNNLRNLEKVESYVTKKIKQQQQGKMILEEKDIVSFFQGVMRSYDEKLEIAKERQAAVHQRLKEAKIRKELLINHIDNLEEGLKYHSYENGRFKGNQAGNEFKNSKASNHISAYMGSNTQNISKWREVKPNITNLLTTASKFIPN